MSQPAEKSFAYARRTPELSLLYKTVQENLNTFIHQRENEGKPLPLHVIKEFEAYLKCGQLQYGFMRVKCEKCELTHLVAFSCKKRGFCSSCGAKRMAETAVHLIDNVLPWVDYRQWVVSLPIELRFWVIANKKLQAKIAKIIYQCVSGFLIQKAKDQGITGVLTPGAISFTQLFGSAINANPHYHVLFTEGVYQEREKLKPRFFRLPPPTDNEVADVVATIADKVIKHLKRKNYLPEEGREVVRPDLDPLFDEGSSYASSIAHSIRHRIAFGERAGEFVRRIGSSFGYEEELVLIKGEKCARKNGFDLHAAVRVKAEWRQQLQKLIEYMGRPAVSVDRMSLNDRGDILYKLKRKFSDGTTHIVLSPLEFLEKLTALIPPPRLHMVRHYGVFSSHNRLRKQIVLKPDVKKGIISNKEEKPNLSESRWAKLLARCFKIDITTCKNCGGDMQLVSVIKDRDSIKKYLEHIGISSIPPPISPARYQQQQLLYDDWS